jgi:signal transduction histidine kinase
MATEKRIPMQFHPRAFAAFGADLVTNDTVAITELVKNSYDAFAYNVEVEFAEDKRGKYIQILDDGLGMTSDIIEQSWAVIATPYKQKRPTVTRDEKIRRVSGNKGLGRFSAARLGGTLDIWSQSINNSCIRARMNWNAFIESSNVSDCQILLELLLPEKSPFNPSGTIIRIRNLTSEWDKEKIDELKDNLSRLVSPFKRVEQFTIRLMSPFYDAPVEIKPTELIENPTYRISGSVDDLGTVIWQYSFESKSKDMERRQRNGNINWEEARKGFNINISLDEEHIPSYKAGAFSFEIRAWDLDNKSLEDLSRTFDLKRREIRNTISQYKGISIYRDDVLVLPKSTASRDWLGIDLRRVSDLGHRLSTSQIIGIVNISSESNPGIKDTTDREKLVDTQEYVQFTKVVETVISQLQNLRFSDKRDESLPDKTNISSLMAPFSAQNLVLKIEDAVERDKKSEDILEYVREYVSESERGLTFLQNRLTYYAQTASLGSISIVLLHEMLTGMTVIKRFLRRALKEYSPFDERTQEYYDDAERSHARIIEVTKSFTPLYRRDLHKTTNVCNLKITLENSIRLIQAQKFSKNINIRNRLPENIFVPLYDGELQTIFVNLIDNACYWLQRNGENMEIDISYELVEMGNRIKIAVSDNGPGISNKDAQSIFDAGVTSKPHGIGMGLVIVAEILDYYKGKIATIIPGTKGGATFVFDLPTT